MTGNQHSTQYVHLTLQLSEDDRDIQRKQWRTQEFCSRGGGSTNSVEDRGQGERGSVGGSPLSQEFWRQL